MDWFFLSCTRGSVGVRGKHHQVGFGEKIGGTTLGQHQQQVANREFCPVPKLWIWIWVTISLCSWWSGECEVIRSGAGWKTRPDSPNLMSRSRHRQVSQEGRATSRLVGQVWESWEGLREWAWEGTWGNRFGQKL